jgi:hypothetical protein
LSCQKGILSVPDEGLKVGEFRTIVETSGWVAGCTTQADCWTFTVEKWVMASAYSGDPNKR